MGFPKWKSIAQLIVPREPSHIKPIVALFMIRIAILQDHAPCASILPNLISNAPEFLLTGLFQCKAKAIETLLKVPTDIVVLDLHDPLIGIEWMKEIKKHFPSVKWLVYTLHEDGVTIFNALRAGANGYKLKSMDFEPLKIAFQELMTGAAPLSPKILPKLLAYFHQQTPKENNQHILSQREKEILQFASRGLLYKEIAHQLGIERETVKKHFSKIYEKLNVQNKVEALNKYYGMP